MTPKAETTHLLNERPNAWAAPPLLQQMALVVRSMAGTWALRPSSCNLQIL